MKSELHVTSEISAYEQQIEVINQLRKRVLEGVEELEKSYKGIIYVKAEFEAIKKQNIEEIRLYRFAIASECKAIQETAKTINEVCSKERLAQLKEFADTCERLSKLSDSGFFENFKLSK